METPTTFDILIRDCMLLQPDFSAVPIAALGIREGRIEAIVADAADAEAFTAETVIDGSGRLAMPGLVDAHTHSAQQLLRGSVVDELPMVWARILVPFESSLTPEDMYRGALLFCIENLKAGTTTFADAGGPFMASVAQAVVETGIRGVVARSTMDTGAFITDNMRETVDEAISRTEELYDEYNGAGDGRVSVWFALRQAMTSTPALAEAVAARSKALGTGVHIHLAEHLAEIAHCLENYQMRPAEWFDSFGLLGPNLIAAHSVRLSDEEVLLMRDRDANAVHCPRSNLGNHGVPKTPLFMALGVNIALGTDGASGTRLDMFEQMRLLKSAIQEEYGVDINDPLALPALDMLKMVTQGGAKATMLQDEIGTLEVGKLADLILLDIDQPHISPTADLPQTVAMAAGPSDVTDVIVNGRLIIRNREFLHLDEEKIRRDAGQALLEIGKKAGLAMRSPYVG